MDKKQNPQVRVGGKACRKKNAKKRENGSGKRSVRGRKV